jgi:hypothetical protein
VLALLAAGALACAWVEWLAWIEHRAGRELAQRPFGWVRWLVLAGAVGVSLLPPAARVINRLLDRIRHPSPRAAERAALAIAVLSAGYFLLTALLQDRDLFPKTHDEGSYAIQMQMLARGRLWMPQHPLADFFDTFYVLVKPVYASQYFPGTALMYVPSVWLGWPTWVLPLLASGAIVGLVYHIVTELVDGVAGAMAALLMVSLSWFRMLSILLFSQVPLLLLGLLLIWAWLRWRRSRRRGWLAAIGALAGWAAITRPADALCFALPVGAAIAHDLFRRPARQWAEAAALIVAGALPFLAIQVRLNLGVTGSRLKTPFALYAQRDFPQTEFGFPRYDPAVRPASSLPQKQQVYDEWAVPYIKLHQPDTVAKAWVGRWLPMAFSAALPARVLLVPLFIGVLGLTSSPRRVLASALPLLFLAYVPHTFFLEHYAVVVAPAVALLVVLGFRALEEAWPTYRSMIAAASAAAVLAVSLSSLHELNRSVDDEPFHSEMLRFVNQQLPYLPQVQKPAVVLFRWAPGENPIEEPVYNFDVAWPDDARIIRAHDLGERNRDIFAYYARIQSDRTFYLFDRKTKTLTPLGPATALAGAAPAPPSK